MSLIGIQSPPEMVSTIPQFGAPDPAAYVLRPGGYAVIFSAAGEVAAVSTPAGLMLPGGGQQAAESPEQAAIRETAEECGLRIALTEPIGVADELAYAAEERTHFHKHCTFFLAEIVGRIDPPECDHPLVWLPSSIAAGRLVHQSQQWAVADACRQFDRRT